MQALLLELGHRFHGLEQLGHVAGLLGSAHQGLHVFREAGAAVAAAGPDELEAIALRLLRRRSLLEEKQLRGPVPMPMRTRSRSAPRRSARLASSFMNEILVASMALAAYLVSSAERRSITTMRSWLRLKGEPLEIGHGGALLKELRVRHHLKRDRHAAGLLFGADGVCHLAGVTVVPRHDEETDGNAWP